ncbi:MAG: hypothetical protein GF368_05215 [Candidatus Aenigmarchaeota archaeon]|nr:hypothetical protein [Candidatus Aenigmarchaeota archaeon]
MSESHFWIKDGIRFVYLSGDSPYEIGYSHGRLLKEEIGEFIEKIKNLIKGEFGGFLGTIILKFLIFRINLLKKKIPPDVLEEMRGIADGSGQDLKWIITSNEGYEVFVSLQGLLGLYRCSFFAAPWKDSDYTVIGKTTDLTNYSPLSDIFSKKRVVFIYDYKWLGKKVINLSFPMCLSGDTSILEDGSMCAFNDGGWASGINFRDLPVFIITKQASKVSKNASDLLGNIKKYKTMKPYVYLISDGTKENSFLVEACEGDYFVKKFDGRLINTNHFESEEMRKKHYKKGYENDILYTNTFERYNNLKNNVKEFSNLKEAIEVLKIHEDTFKIDNGSISNLGTVQAYVYFPRERKLLIPDGQKAPVTLNSKWVDFSLDEIFNHKKQS